jgi:hypothetical protein
MTAPYLYEYIIIHSFSRLRYLADVLTKPELLVSGPGDGTGVGQYVKRIDVDLRYVPGRPHTDWTEETMDDFLKMYHRCPNLHILYNGKRHLERHSAWAFGIFAPKRLISGLIASGDAEKRPSKLRYLDWSAGSSYSVRSSVRGLAQSIGNTLEVLVLQWSFDEVETSGDIDVISFPCLHTLELTDQSESIAMMLNFTDWIAMWDLPSLTRFRTSSWGEMTQTFIEEVVARFLGVHGHKITHLDIYPQGILERFDFSRGAANTLIALKNLVVYPFNIDFRMPPSLPELERLCIWYDSGGDIVQQAEELLRHPQAPGGLSVLEVFMADVLDCDFPKLSSIQLVNIERDTLDILLSEDWGRFRDLWPNWLRKFDGRSVALHIHDGELYEFS